MDPSEVSEARVMTAGFMSSPEFDARSIKDRAVEHQRTDPVDLNSSRMAREMQKNQ
jgi:hypothetical protein